MSNCGCLGKMEGGLGMDGADNSSIPAEGIRVFTIPSFPSPPKLATLNSLGSVPKWAKFERNRLESTEIPGLQIKPGN